MSADFDDIVKQGYLKVKSKNLGTWNKRWILLKRASSKGETRLEKFPDEKSAILNKEDPKPIFFNNVKAVSRLPNEVKKHAFALVFSDNTSRQFASDSDMDADEWHTFLTKSSQRRNIAAGPNLDILRHGSQSDDCFNVYLLPSPNLDLYGECILQVTIEHINIWDVIDSTKKLVSWPLTALRRYGKDDNKFTLETGRHCDTGQGLFVFNTSQGPKMYQKVHSASVAIAEAHRIVNKQQSDPLSTSNRPPLRANSEKSPGTEFHPIVKPSVSYSGGDRAPLPLPRTSDAPAAASCFPLPAKTNNSHQYTRKPLPDPLRLKAKLNVEESDESDGGGDYETALLQRPLPPPPTKGGATRGTGSSTSADSSLYTSSSSNSFSYSTSSASSSKASPNSQSSQSPMGGGNSMQQQQPAGPKYVNSTQVSKDSSTDNVETGTTVKNSATAAITNNNNNDEDPDDLYIYEEKYLEPAFKHFLSQRKKEGD